jgi:hypothetical protein
MHMMYKQEDFRVKLSLIGPGQLIIYDVIKLNKIHIYLGTYGNVVSTVPSLYKTYFEEF